MSESVHLLAGAFALDALDPAERAEFESHLAGCPDCTAEVREMLATAARLVAADSIRPPAELKRSVLAEVARTAQEHPPASAEGPRAERLGAAESGRSGVVPFRRRRAQLLFAVAAAVLAVVAVGLAALLVQARVDRNAIAERQQAVSSVLTAPDRRIGGASMPGGARAVVVVSDSRHEAALVGTGMASPPPGHVYQLWYLRSDGSAVSAGVFTPSQDGTVALLLHGDPATAAQVGVTVEPDGGSAKPTTAPVLAVPITA